MENVIVFSVLIAVGCLALWQLFIFPYFYLKPIEKEGLDQAKYCLIDVRDFISFYRQPTNQAKNIPLSYLPREVKSDSLCDREIVVVAENKKSAKMAARIINKQFKKQVYYYTV